MTQQPRPSEHSHGWSGVTKAFKFPSKVCFQTRGSVCTQEKPQSGTSRAGASVQNDEKLERKPEKSQLQVGRVYCSAESDASGIKHLWKLFSNIEFTAQGKYIS